MGNDSLIKISLIDRIKNKIKYAFGYREGKKFMLDTEPYYKNYSDLELFNVANIEKKLKDIIENNNKSENLVDGISREEARALLEWVVQRDRKILSLDKNLKDASLLGCCGLSQGIVSTLLSNMSLKPRVSNINPTITGERSWGTCF